jgi:hypothetical protein
VLLNAIHGTFRQTPSVSDVLVSRVTRDGADWLIGTGAEVAWINAATTIDVTITSAIPAVFDAYATVVVPETRGDQQRHDRAVVALLNMQSPDQQWWLGYLDTGSDDVVFPDAPMVTLCAGWSYVLVQAGPAQAASWRLWDDFGSFRSGRLPNLMFPMDRSWLVSKLWDDVWTCVGGPFELIDGFLSHPDLRPRVRQVSLGEDATPPGHQAI